MERIKKVLKKIFLGLFLITIPLVEANFLVYVGHEFVLNFSEKISFDHGVSIMVVGIILVVLHIVWWIELSETILFKKAKTFLKRMKKGKC